MTYDRSPPGQGSQQGSVHQGQQSAPSISERRPFEQTPSATNNTASFVTKAVNTGTQTDLRDVSSLSNFGNLPPHSDRENSQDQYRISRADEPAPQPAVREVSILGRVTYTPTRAGPATDAKAGRQPPDDRSPSPSPPEIRAPRPDPRPPAAKPQVIDRPPFDLGSKPRVDLSNAEEGQKEPKKPPVKNNVVPVKPKVEQSHDETIFIDEPDHYPPLYSEDERRKSEIGPQKQNFSSRENNGSQGSRGDPRSYYNEHMKRESLKKQLAEGDDLHSARRSHSRKQDQTIKSLIEEKEALQKLLQKMIKENLRNNSPDNQPRYMSPTGSKDPPFIKKAFRITKEAIFWKQKKEQRLDTNQKEGKNRNFSK